MPIEQLTAEEREAVADAVRAEIKAGSNVRDVNWSFIDLLRSALRKLEGN